MSVFLACIETLSKGYVFRGQGQSELSHYITTVENRNSKIDLNFLREQPNGTWASLHFDGADAELDLKDSWHLDCHVPVTLFTQVIGNIERRDIDEFIIGLRLYDGAYTAEWYAPPSARIDWKLLPQADGRRSATPAYGTIAYVQATSGKRALIALGEIGEDIEPSNQSENKETAPSYISKQLQEAISTLKVVGWSIFAALLLVAIRS